MGGDWKTGLRGESVGNGWKCGLLAGFENLENIGLIAGEPAPMARIELATSPLPRERSATELHGRLKSRRDRSGSGMGSG